MERKALLSSQRPKDQIIKQEALNVLVQVQETTSPVSKVIKYNNNSNKILKMGRITPLQRRPSSILRYIWILPLVDSEGSPRILSFSLSSQILPPSRYKITRLRSSKYLITTSNRKITRG